jgi:hypothetical protein
MNSPELRIRMQCEWFFSEGSAKLTGKVKTVQCGNRSEWAYLNRNGRTFFYCSAHRHLFIEADPREANDLNWSRLPPLSAYEQAAFPTA